MQANRIRGRPACRRRSGTICVAQAFPTFSGGLGFRVGRSDMSISDDDTEQKDTIVRDNIVRLGTETLFAIGEELRRMYEADLRSKPSNELERLMRQIERGEGVDASPE